MDKPTKQDEAAARKRGYEGATPRISIPAISAVVLLVLVAAAVLLMAGMFYALVAYHDAHDPGLPPMAASRMPPAGPRLLPDNADQVRQQRAMEDSLLGGYAWVDRENGYVRIPLDRAISLVSARGLPASPQPGGKP
jgi:hypothetical protein